MIVARTDAEAASLLDNNVDPRDHPFIMGATVPGTRRVPFFRSFSQPSGAPFPAPGVEAGCRVERCRIVLKHGIEGLMRIGGAMHPMKWTFGVLQLDPHLACLVRLDTRWYPALRSFYCRVIRSPPLMTCVYLSLFAPCLNLENIATFLRVLNDIIREAQAGGATFAAIEKLSKEWTERAGLMRFPEVRMGR